MMRTSLAVCVASMALGGCVAPVQETRAYGVSRPAPGAEVVATRERERPPGTGCRTVVTTSPAMHEVDVRRSFVDSRRQQANMALAVLAGIGSTFIAFDASKLACQTDGGTCTGLLTSATWPIAAATAALAAVPLGFLFYNAARAQDDVRTEPAPPIIEPGPWEPCEATGPAVAP
jgi:hypothetical protein